MYPNHNRNQGYQSYGPVEGAYPQQGYQAGPQYAAGGYADSIDTGQGIYEGDLASASVAAFAKKVYVYFASALLTATLASVGGVMAVEHFIATQNISALGTMRILSLVAFFGSFLFVVLTRKAHSPLKTGLLYVFAGACGMMIAPMLTFFMKSGMGMSIVFAFGIATVVWGGLSVYVLATGKDFRGLGGYLFAGILLVLGLILLNIFVPFPDAISRLVMAGILLLFVGYTLYDTSRVTRDYYHANDAVGAALMLFYDFFILFKYILYFLGGSRD
ncbi:MAG: US12 family protein [Planctomycetes bacterium]|nr:US12 family protein [Planctomycetota bacterium]